jgi:hypothetical protein
MLQRANLLSVTLVVLSLIIFLATVWRTDKSGWAFQDDPSALACKMSCSDTELRTSIAELTWQADTLPTDLSQQALEVTVFKDGFQRGIKARLTPVQNGQQFTLFTPLNQSAPGLERLVLADVQTLPGGRVQVRVKGPEAGLNYFWRLQTADGSTTLSKTVRCQAPVCPADEPRGTNTESR